MSSHPPIAPHSTRKFRRTRDAPSGNSDNEIPSGFDLYTIQGDSAGALKVFLHQQQQQRKRQQQELTDGGANTLHAKDCVSIASKYNCTLLSQISVSGQNRPPRSRHSNSIFLKNLEEIELLYEQSKIDKTRDSHHFFSARKFRRNDYILSYNKLLLMFAFGDVRKCARMCSDKISGMIYHCHNHNASSVKQSQRSSASSSSDNITTKLTDDITAVAARMAFLMLECVLYMSVGRNRGLKAITTSMGIPPVEMVLEWLESLTLVSNNSHNVNGQDIQNKDPQLKFLFSLYKTRLALTDLDDQSGKHVESHIRSARKDMKTAMEIFQHKLRATFGSETASVVSSANSEENMSTAGGNSAIRIESQQTSSPGTVVLQKLNQSALSLKAHLEQMKGNVKKSLILCSEAAGTDEANNSNSGYEAVHSNNLAVVYETIDKYHLALHAIAKSLRANAEDFTVSENENNGDDSSSSSNQLLFHSDGTVRPNISMMLLHNAGICALRAQNFIASYECFATCVSRSNVFYDRPSSWIRMAQACIGIWVQHRQPQNSNGSSNQGHHLSAVHIDGQPQGIIIDKAMFRDDVAVGHQELEPVLASTADIEQVKANPLLRARACLEHALQFEACMNSETLASARLSNAYVCLAFGNYKRALDLSKLVIETEESLRDSDNQFTQSLRKRHVATARMYAAEASCALGDLVNSLKFISGDGKDDAFDRLASDLGGVSLETATTNDTGKHRLAKAQAMVRSSACAITVAMGNLQAAKQLAHSANAMEDAFSSNRDKFSARRALLYTLLREGNQSPALAMLLSRRS